MCVGETRAEREAGRTLDVVGRQLAGSIPRRDAANIVIAYEPVWAIGTGLTPTAADVADVHDFIRTGSARRWAGRGQGTHSLWRVGQAGQCGRAHGRANVDGALVGGASLKAADFLGIAAAYR